MDNGRAGLVTGQGTACTTTSLTCCLPRSSRRASPSRSCQLRFCVVRFVGLRFAGLLAAVRLAVLLFAVLVFAVFRLPVLGLRLVFFAVLRLAAEFVVALARLVTALRVVAPREPEVVFFAALLLAVLLDVRDRVLFAGTVSPAVRMASSAFPA